MSSLSSICNQIAMGTCSRLPEKQDTAPLIQTAKESTSAESPHLNFIL